MEFTGLNEKKYIGMLTINGLIGRGQMPSAAEVRAAGAEAHFALIPLGLLASVVRKNAATFETSSRVAVKRSTRRTVVMTQDQIDEMVENRDLTKYPLAAWEIKDREMVRVRRRAMLEQF
jgi:hypothetical protein